MGWIKDNSAKADEMYRALLTPLLAPDEQLLGALQATQSKSFSAKIWVIGVTPQRLLMVEVDRKFQAKAAPVVVHPQDITKSSVDGFGGGLSHFRKTDLGDIRFDTASDSYKLQALGGGMDQMLTGDAQMNGKSAFLQFLANARGIK
jgi:hypothetical protein